MHMVVPSYNIMNIDNQVRLTSITLLRSTQKQNVERRLFFFLGPSAAKAQRWSKIFKKVICPVTQNSQFGHTSNA